jgi:hypothetical protein
MEDVDVEGKDHLFFDPDLWNVIKVPDKFDIPFLGKSGPNLP